MLATKGSARLTGDTPEDNKGADQVGSKTHGLAREDGAVKQ